MLLLRFCAPMPSLRVTRSFGTCHPGPIATLRKKKNPSIFLSRSVECAVESARELIGFFFFFSTIVFSAIVSSRKRKLQELYAVSRHIERSKPFPGRQVAPDDVESRFLDDNDIEK